MAITPALELGGNSTVLLRQHDVRRALAMRDCITAVEHAFVSHAQGETLGPAVLAVHVPGGGFHVKAAGLSSRSRSPVFVAKVNANFPGYPSSCGLPTIQGVLGLFDASNGRVLALMDSGEITSLRTAAATAVAAKHLAPTVADVVICGCGEQARTSSRRWFLGREHVAPGCFVAAVGADSPQKQEIEPELLASSVVIADVLEQSATIGDLHHALEAGVMRREDVRGELADVVSGRIRGRRSNDEIVIFDSTGTALQDVAAAAVAYDHAVARGDCLTIELSEA